MKIILIISLALLDDEKIGHKNLIKGKIYFISLMYISLKIALLVFLREKDELLRGSIL